MRCAARFGSRFAAGERGRQLIVISLAQLDDFAGNLLRTTQSLKDSPVWVMSSRAFAALHPAQREQLARGATLLHTPLPTIECVGGGSARCMLGELFRPALPF